MDVQNHIDEQALLDYYSGILSPEQKKKVEEWINLSEENKKVAHDVEYLNYALNTVAAIQSVNVEQGWCKVKNRILPAKMNSFLLWFQRVVAVLVIPLFVLSFYLMIHEDPIEYFEVKTNPGMVTSLTLPDGSKVWLNSGSILRYPHKFADDVRDVQLNGEAYFSVHKDKKKKFIVSTTSDLKAEVLGTEFNMEAYGDENQIKISLVSGSVRLSFTHSNKSILMHPEDQVVYNVKEKTYNKFKTNVGIVTSWKDGIIIFRNTPLEESLRMLSKRFNVEFIVKNKLLYKYSFTGVFEDQHLSSVLEHLRISSNIKYKYLSVDEEQKETKEKNRIELY